MKLLLITLVSLLSFCGAAERVKIINKSEEELHINLELRPKFENYKKQRIVSGTTRRNSVMYRTLESWDKGLSDWRVFVKIIGEQRTADCEPILYKEILDVDKEVTISYDGSKCRVIILRTCL